MNSTAFCFLLPLVACATTASEAIPASFWRQSPTVNLYLEPLFDSGNSGRRSKHRYAVVRGLSSAASTIVVLLVLPYVAVSESKPSAHPALTQAESGCPQHHWQPEPGPGHPPHSVHWHHGIASAPRPGPRAGPPPFLQKHASWHVVSRTLKATPQNHSTPTSRTSSRFSYS
eukprot:2112128-Rhodomonas_salina.1